MAPAPSLVVPAPSLSSDHLRSFHRHILSLSRHTLAQPPVMRRGHSLPRAPETTLQPSFIPDGSSQLPPPPPTDTPPLVLSEQPGPTPTDTAYINSQPQPQTTEQPGDVPGNIVAGIAVAVLILGGLVGLVLGGEIFRQRMKKTPEERTWLGCLRRKRSRTTKRTSKNSTTSSSERTEASPEKFSRDAKMSPPLTPPSAAVSREGRGRLSSVWPIRSLSQALRSHRRVAKVSPLVRQQTSLVASPQTTWSEFTPVRLYAAPPRTVLPGIPEEREEDRRSQTDSDFAIMLGVALQRSYSNPVESNSHQSTGSTRGSTEIDMQHASEEHEETKSLESSAPDMTSDGGGSSRSSMAFLDESLSGEMFELRKAQTRSMQMNKGILLSLSGKTLEDNRVVGAVGCTSSPTLELDAGVSKEYADSGLTMEMLGGSFSAINLDDFPSPPSVLPVIPSFVSSF